MDPLNPDNLSFDPRPSTPLSPTPSAEPAKVIAWLFHVRAGAIINMVVLLGGMGTMAMAYPGGPGYGPGLRIADAFLTLAGIQALWLLTAPEPGNARWLAAPRAVLRAVAILAGCEAAISIAQLGAPGLPTYQTQSETVKSIISLITTCRMAMEIWYLRELARRLQDTTLRKNWTVLLCIVLLLVLIQIVGTLTPSADPGLSQAASRPAGSRPATFPIGCVVPYFAVWLWPAWLLWRLAGRLQRAAAVIEARQDSPPGDAHSPPPEAGD